ncbi:putative entry exclusion protein TrbK-alt [Brevundimonas sp.]|uniref:putative entry exclusion protein TrbK-alt n=1 Tax=Brevundimonas sp. TaxID=1871086 RepID=UPI002699542D|nr:putative entry exclusion protein TrbK-alt [Brevundimonas sp.]
MRANPMGAATAVIAIAALAAAALAASAPPRNAPQSVAAAPHPVSSALARCRALGEAGGADPTCQAAWADQRRRFFAGPTTTAVAGSAEQ